MYTLTPPSPPHHTQQHRHAHTAGLTASDFQRGSRLGLCARPRGRRSVKVTSQVGVVCSGSFLFTTKASCLGSPAPQNRHEGRHVNLPESGHRWKICTLPPGGVYIFYIFACIYSPSHCEPSELLNGNSVFSVLTGVFLHTRAHTHVHTLSH